MAITQKDDQCSTLRLSRAMRRRVERLVALAIKEGLVVSGPVWPIQVKQSHVLRLAVEIGLDAVPTLLQKGIAIPNEDGDTPSDVRMSAKTAAQVQRVVAEARLEGCRVPGLRKPVMVKQSHVLRLAVREGLDRVLPRLRGMLPILERQRVMLEAEREGAAG